MKWLRRLVAALGILALALLVAVVAVGFPPSWGAGAILHPARRPVGPPPALPHRDVTVESGDVTLKGWFFPASGASRGITVVYLHGSADNRDSGNWIAERLVPKGFDVLAYDGRAHGDSTGNACTYGVLEKQDLQRVLDQLKVRRAILSADHSAPRSRSRRRPTIRASSRSSPRRPSPTSGASRATARPSR